MGTNDRKGSVTTAAEVLGRSSKSGKKAAGSGLASISSSLGNDELLERIKAGNGNRDDLLEYLVERLAHMRTAQLAEIEQSMNTENSFRTTLGDSANQNEQLNPRRWIPAAKLYQDASRALCSGQLHRGMELVEQANLEEKKAFTELSKFVECDAEQSDGPEVHPLPDTACTDCREPVGVHVADEIQAVTTEGNPNVKGQRRELDPWWTDLEEEEEEEANE